MRAVVLISAALALVGLGAFTALTWPAHLSEADLAGLEGDASRGEAVFWAAGCASCHAAEDATGEDRLVLSGGGRLNSDFGTFVAPNVSMDAEHGIGGWTQAQFVTAVTRGVSPDGRHYYPAFPYASYALAERQDIVDLWAFWRTLPASDTPSQPHELAFPFTIRRGIGLWKLLNVHDDFAVRGALGAEAMRGRYLAEALAHCAECHTPRDATGGLDRDRWFAGAPNPSGTGTIPALTPDDLTWSRDEIAAYLKDGFAPDFDTASGSMASVVRNLANLDDADRQAIAAYLKALPEASD
ncbi:cytochrome c [Roseibacterium sp. SDUM158017]|uniref:cytochrome c n=1 Tax=Roseicyclus salinarum TaxID=3036773 RepID=UPI002414D0CE|nr:cytochrome c [Roseibacterium sp. SDUM158017]MDG4648787.1 cytochrome c [Roseibacterium sp. SDUM158017]